MKRYPPRRQKNYVWMGVVANGAVDTAAVATASLYVAADWAGASVTSKRHCNIQRLLVDICIGIPNSKLTDPTSAVWGPWAWMIYLADTDDTTIYDPTSFLDLTQETILAHGLENSIGWGTIDNVLVLGSGNVQSQTAAFMASERKRIDIRTNRRLGTDQSIRMAVTRDSTNTNMVNDGGVDYEFSISSRCLLKLPG